MFVVPSMVEVCREKEVVVGDLVVEKVEVSMGEEEAKVKVVNREVEDLVRVGREKEGVEEGVQAKEKVILEGSSEVEEKD